MSNESYSQIPDTVLSGLDGHLFDRIGPVTEQMSATVTLSPALARRWVSLIETRHAWCQQRGARYFCLVTPAKEAIYPDKLPNWALLSADRAIVRLQAALTPEIRASVIYPAKLLIDGRAREETYYTADTHWTDFAAYLVYRDLLEKMQLNQPGPIPESALVRSSYRRMGDLGIKVTPERDELVVGLAAPADRPVRTVFANSTYNFGQVEVLETDLSNGPRGVIFRDSSGSFLLPFLATHFKRLVAVATDNVFYDLLRSEKPDIVITQLSEYTFCFPSRNGSETFHFPDDMPPIDFAAFSGVALPLVSQAVATETDSIIADLDFDRRPEPAWTEGESTEMVLKCRVPYSDCTLSLTVSPFVHLPVLPSQAVDIAINGAIVGSFVVTGERETLICSVPLACLYSGRILRIELFHADAASPKDLGLGDDLRELGLQLHRLTISPVTRQS